MRRKYLMLIIVLLLAGAGYYGYTAYYAPSLEPTPTPELVDVGQQVIWASGEVVPVQHAQLSFQPGGQVEQVMVEEGDRVEAGAPLVRLKPTELESGVRAAEAALQMARAELARVKAGARAEEIAAAEAAVEQAEAVLEGARALLRSAQAEYERLLVGAREEEVTAAAAAVAKAEAALRLAQTEYDRIKWASEAAISPQALALEQATLDHETALANYQAVLRGATPQEVAGAAAAVDAAAQDVRRAEAAVAQAQAQLALMQAGARPEDIAAAEAAVAQVEVQLDLARTALDEATLRAPFAATVGSVLVREGELVTPGAPVVVIGDLSHLRVETTDLRETDITRVRVGQPVEITFDALPDLILPGRVSQIAPKATTVAGGTNYRTIIEFDATVPELRWGMTAFVNIEVD